MCKDASLASYELMLACTYRILAVLYGQASSSVFSQSFGSSFSRLQQQDLISEIGDSICTFVELALLAVRAGWKFSITKLTSKCHPVSV
jgi:hypothetical protein